MKYCFIILICAFNTINAQNTTTIKWHSFKEIEQLQSKQQKKIFIDVFTDWCGPCQAIKPFFSGLPNQYPQVRFFKVAIYLL